MHAVVHGKVIPLAYALLPSKTADMYKRFFTALLLKIKEATGDDEFEGPIFMQVDSEQAAITAFQDVFTRSDVKGKHKRNYLSGVLHVNDCVDRLYFQGACSILDNPFTESCKN